jgi:hypothetical protein
MIKISKMKVPFFRLNYSNKYSYLLGTNHWYPTIPNAIYNQLINCKNLVSESGYDKSINFDHKNILTYINQNEPLKNFKYFQPPIWFDPYEHVRKHKETQILSSIKSNDLTNIMSDQLFGSFFTLNDINTKFISLLTMKMLYLNGLDHKLMNYYFAKNRNIYGLDVIDDEYKRELKGYFEDMIQYISNNLIQFAYEDRWYYKYDFNNFLISMSNRSSSDYFKVDFDIVRKEPNNCINEKFIYEKRNNNWIPKIINYHNMLENPLFLVGYGHLYGKHDLLKKLKEKDFEIEIYDISNNRFF